MIFATARPASSWAQTWDSEQIKVMFSTTESPRLGTFLRDYSECRSMMHTLRMCCMCSSARAWETSGFRLCIKQKLRANYCPGDKEQSKVMLLVEQ